MNTIINHNLTFYTYTFTKEFVLLLEYLNKLTEISYLFIRQGFFGGKR